MITLNDYLYSGDTVLQILEDYSSDLMKEASKTGSSIDMIHANFLLQEREMLLHNNFLSSQAQRVREFYKLMIQMYPFLTSSFRGRIKSLIRAEEKFNGYIVQKTIKDYQQTGRFPSVAELRDHLSLIRDLIAYRIVISMPKRYLKEGESAEEIELKYLYEAANMLPEFLEKSGFSVVTKGFEVTPGNMLKESVRPYYKDYVNTPNSFGYRSLHVSFYDNIARCYLEVQLRTKAMDDYAEIGPANHVNYEANQKNARTQRGVIPDGACQYFDDAFYRGVILQNLDFTNVDVNMFSAVNNNVFNDACGLLKGRLILPYEHLSKDQNDLIID